MLVMFLFMMLSHLLYAQPMEYKKIKIYGTEEDLNGLRKKGVCLDHGDGNGKTWFSSYFNSQEVELIRASGLKYDVLIDDTKAYYKAQRENAVQMKLPPNGTCSDPGAPVYQVPSHFKYGSMGGFYTYAQMLADLDSMALLYPNLITTRQPIDTGLTWDGNPSYYVKISDNPTMMEPEPQVYYSALHHAREPLSMQQLIFYMWYLLENYQTDSLVKQLVDNRESYFIPCVNPDGYLYNELTDPFGGGLWRKNRRDNADGTFGVDLNRNYDMFWGYDDTGSSPNSGSEVYRGVSPVSEPEIQMVTAFINNHQFVTGLDFHTYGDHLLYPWSHVPDLYTPDSAAYVALSESFTAYNDYTFGTCNQTLNYVVNGGSADWLYGEQVTKPKVFDFSPECGYDFWPAQSDIIPIIQDAIHLDVMTALVAGKYARLGDDGPPVVSTVNGFIPFQLTQLGLDTNAAYTISVTPLSPQIISTGNAKTYSNLSFLQTLHDSIAYSLSGMQLNGTELRFLLTIDFGNFQEHDTLVKYFGTPVILLADDGSSMANWANGSQWGNTTSSYFSPPASITDSPLGNYMPFDNNPLITAASINLVPAVKAGLGFYAHWQIESKSDYVEVRVSDDGGISWTPLCGKYTHPGAGAQDAGMPLYDALRSNWVKEEMSLNDYIGKNISLQFLLVSDPFNEQDGFYFDDLTVWSLNNNVGVHETDAPVAISHVFPNPARTTAEVSYAIPPHGHYQLRVTNMLGQQVITQALDPAANRVVLRVNRLHAGIYNVMITDGTRNLAVKAFAVMNE